MSIVSIPKSNGTCIHIHVPYICIGYIMEMAKINFIIFFFQCSGLEGTAGFFKPKAINFCDLDICFVLRAY